MKIADLFWWNGKAMIYWRNLWNNFYMRLLENVKFNSISVLRRTVCNRCKTRKSRWHLLVLFEVRIIFQIKKQHSELPHLQNHNRLFTNVSDANLFGTVMKTARYVFLGYHSNWKKNKSVQKTTKTDFLPAGEVQKLTRLSVFWTLVGKRLLINTRITDLSI